MGEVDERVPRAGEIRSYATAFTAHVTGRNRLPIALTAPLVPLLFAALTGCSGDTGADSAQPAKPARSKAAAQKDGRSEHAAPARPRTAEEFLARAEEAMSGAKGWTFAVKGREGLTTRGQQSAATYTATVRRTTGKTWALHSTGTSYSKGVGKPEELYVADGTAYVKEGGAGADWKHGPLSEPEFANKVEDPVAALEAFRTYAANPASGDGISLVRSGAKVELRIRTASASLSSARERNVVKKAARELSPTLEKLRAAGVTASESQITVERAEESLVLDASTYRITSHTFRCSFGIPYGGQTIRYSQDVSEHNEGQLAGTVTLPPEVTAIRG
ncbi:hypothetical protein ACFOZ0_15675 [Streptomyces yaanensis]|uniref:Lipoprotein n=1 Tax=Streptomyces yaanensis TaxID=1142239 RepID=A0ABV7SDI8_9ACTN|nr:hypothetical protein [Streptomyces sp. CGMCC 4.7035]WNB98492.1 hypothetical protein Q2K21_10625 [Streptomyces sp. CGMCC 4.7035]